MSLNKFERFSIFILIILAIIFRLLFVKDNKIHFYFDQARDANISRSIIENRDFKIQGPSASGTDETLYHGVLYYYLIAPVYTFSGGNPAAVVFVLILINSLATIPIYLIVRDISKSKITAFFTSILYAFSIDAAQISSFLFNASILAFSLPWLFYFIWKVFFEKRKKYLPWLALAIGISNQFAIFSTYFILLIIFLYFYKSHQAKRLILFKPKLILKSFIVYLLTISSILLAQFKLFQAGIFNPLTVFGQVQHTIDLPKALSSMFRLFSQKISMSLFPSYITFSFFVFAVILIWFLLQKAYKRFRLFVILWLFSPLWLFVFAFKDSYHVLFGMLPVIYFVVSLWLYRLTKSSVGILTLLLFFCFFLVSNVSELKKIRAREFGRISVQKGAFLHRQLSLIDHTYKTSGGKEFSISSLTAPHGWNTTWAYLYDWYGNSKYGYKPSWFGPSQKGIPAGELLKRIEKPLDLHFTIYDPDPGSLDVHRFQFEDEQNLFAGSPSATLNFGRLILEKR